MPSNTPEAITLLLHAVHKGDHSAIASLFEVVYDELRRLARVVRKGRAGETLNTTALVHEAYIKLVPSADMTFHNRVHFFRVAARAMRQVLVSQARKKLAQKRGGDVLQVPFDEHIHAVLLERPGLLIELDKALEELEGMNARQAQVVECRFFAGMTIEETAYALNLSEPTVNRDWRAARAWLALRLQEQ